MPSQPVLVKKTIVAFILLTSLHGQCHPEKREDRDPEERGLEKG
jgi:hypothetical protein